MDAMGVALVITLIPFFTKELGVGAVGFGIITSLYGLCQIIGGSVISYLLDSVLSRKSILLISSIGSGLSYSLLLIRGNLIALVFSRMLVGFIKQTTTSCKALVMMSKDCSPNSYSVLAAVRHMGSFVGSALLSWITKRYDEYVAISLSVLIFAVESVVILLFIHESKDKNSPSSPVTTTVEKEQSSKPLQTFKPIIRFHANLGPVPFHLNRSRRDLISNETVLSFAFILYITYLLCIDSLNKGFGAVKIVLLQDQFDVSPHQIGFVYVFSNLFMFITEFIITPIFTRNVCSFSIVVFSLLLLMGGKLCQLLISNFSQYVIFCVILNTIGEEMFATTFVNILGKISPPHLISRYFSYYDIAESICRLVGPVVLGNVISRFAYDGCQRILVLSFLILLLAWIVMPVVNRNDACIDSPFKED
ncbi:transporter, major facilitor subfamily protein [Blastocystis sp. subtype 4]|uniref:transporter, major facilitor subfamily protein n=1 Tax=Blastocystis sp. subtype 4 TaxID=944170 RepID=UPI000711662D|nr:transporter, major facilitor subfamily protein [Blastocystis sp. subtype 4]KNB46404.1 transporter, major facilitor subfamily protein [Blastocystis sp. subtype 4]|eukprot:XP_014529847.1 transporter, major facilitor subfamily protein [Blastocystis sp. subtype 4]